MFRRVSYIIALQFTAFVFILILISGSIFLAVDFNRVRRQTYDLLVQNLQFVIDSSRFTPDGVPAALPRGMSELVRVADKNHRILYEGDVFSDIRFSDKPGLSYATVEHEDYVILTAPIMDSGQPSGHIQVAHLDRFHFSELQDKGFMFLLVNIGISTITFFVGLFFARTSLKPAAAAMERLEQFTQDASHELRTPLATLNSSLDLALKTQKYKEGIESAKDDVKQITILIERLLNLARLDSFLLSKEKIQLSPFVAEIIEKQKVFAEKNNVKIESAITPGVVVMGDPSLVRQVLTNLIMNAVKYSKPGGGTVIVRLSKKELSVQDDGIGIAEASLPHIFDRFYQADASRAKGGLGLGLALVKRIVDLHGWSIDVKSEEGEGTIFTVAIS
jgi:signal transduction histidine kinase